MLIKNVKDFDIIYGYIAMFGEDMVKKYADASEISRFNIYDNNKIIVATKNSSGRRMLCMKVVEQNPKFNSWSNYIYQWRDNDIMAPDSFNCLLEKAKKAIFLRVIVK